MTGGTGTFGMHFVKTVLGRFNPKKLIIFSRDEYKQHEMSKSFPRGKGKGDSAVRYYIGDVRDKDRLYRAFNDVEIVVHAAAMKQIPTCEYNPFEAVQTNIIGTRNVIDAAIDCGVSKVLFLSSDKAVNPVNLYGATKLCAEKMIAQGNFYSQEGKTILSCARYGNVMGSRGSVVPLFMEQKKSGTVTVTDVEMTRFWINMEQGVDFVFQCLDEMLGGEIFVPKAPSVRLIDLVEAIAPDCKVEKIDIRPGEKKHELLISEDESRHTWESDTMYIVEPEHWRVKQRERNAKPVPEGFEFSSRDNDKWLSKDEISSMVFDN